jgi:hypothetical protein
MNEILSFKLSIYIALDVLKALDLGINFKLTFDVLDAFHKINEFLATVFEHVFTRNPTFS